MCGTGNQFSRTILRQSPRLLYVKVASKFVLARLDSIFANGVGIGYQCNLIQYFLVSDCLSDLHNLVSPNSLPALQTSISEMQLADGRRWHLPKSKRLFHRVFWTCVLGPKILGDLECLLKSDVI